MVCKWKGKTWKYRDIYEQFLQRRAKHPNALFIWSGDYPTYQENGTTDYYVILSAKDSAAPRTPPHGARPTGTAPMTASP